jgi:hypothetical protein
MDTLHTMLRAIRGETKHQRRDHLQVFREFLGHLDRIGKRSAPSAGRVEKGGKAEFRGRSLRGR